MKKLILISAIALGLLSSCTKEKTYTIKFIKSGITINTQLDLSDKKIGDTVIIFDNIIDPKNNDYAEFTIISIND